MARQRKSYPEDAKTMIGLSTLNWTETIGGAFNTGLFMLYLTDYANIGAYAATLGTVLLMGGVLLMRLMIRFRDGLWTAQKQQR